MTRAAALKGAWRGGGAAVAAAKALASGAPRERIVEEQAALRRVATLVAQAAPPEEMFTAVSEEVGKLIGADYTFMTRYDADGDGTVVGVWARSTRPAIAVGSRVPLGGRNTATSVFETGRPARIDDLDNASGPAAALGRAAGVRSSAGAPISLEGRLWGVMAVASTQEGPLPADTDTRLAGFTELVATAIANAEVQAALAASRARIVATADATRRSIERDLHDGAQQRLVSLGLQFRGAQAAVPAEADALAESLDAVAAGLSDVLEELRETARGIHPALLASGGLRPALKTLARRSAVPVRLDVSVDERLPEQIEVAVYYVVSEALTNAAKHAHATIVDVEVRRDDGMLRVLVHDDGVGGATFASGTGLVGLKDRVDALGGGITLRSVWGVGTNVEVTLPLDERVS